MIDYNAIILVSIPTIGGIFTYILNLQIKKDDKKLKLIIEYQQHHIMRNVYLRRFLNIIIDKYCKRGELHSSIATKNTMENYLLLVKPNTDINLINHFQELKEKILKNQESILTPLSISKSSKKIANMTYKGNSSLQVLTHIFRKIIYDYNEDDLVADLYLAEAELNTLENLDFIILVHKTFLFDNYILRKIKDLKWKIIYKFDKN